MDAIQDTAEGGLRGLRCLRCQRIFSAELQVDSRGCPNCYDTAPSNLRSCYKEDARAATVSSPTPREASMWRYHGRLPIPKSSIISLGEGLTPLLPANRIGELIGVPDLHIKDEGRNPTWSYKDRFSSVAVSAARSQGARVVSTASSGNAGASLAAYAARAGLQCVVATFVDSAGPMLSQIKKYGAVVLPMVNKADRWQLLDEASAENGWFVTSPYRSPVVGSHPLGIDGYKTIAFELVEQCDGRIPDWCVMPVCYGDGISGVYAGFEELLEAGVIDRIPRFVAAEVHGSLSDALHRNLEHPTQQQMLFDSLAVSIGAPCSTYQALKALRKSDGKAVQVTNEGLIEMQEQLSINEGIFAELAAVTPLLAIQKLRNDGVIRSDDHVVAVVTASGLKDLDRSTATENFDNEFSTPAEALSWLARCNSAGTS